MSGGPDTYELDVDTALAAAGGGRWTGAVTDRWMIGGGPNGGYLATFLIRALCAEMAGPATPDPLSMTVHYLTRPAPGPCAVTVEPLHRANAHAFARATLSQEDRAICTALCAFGRIRPDDVRSTQADMPPTPLAPDDPAAMPQAARPDMDPDAPMISFRKRLEYRDAAPGQTWWSGEPGPAVVGGWTRLADGRPLDSLAVPLFMDCWPPAMFATFLGGMAPTIELTVHWRDQPGAGWHLAQFRSRFLQGGYTEEDGELWSTDGRLVAHSRQLARFRPPGGRPG